MSCYFKSSITAATIIGMSIGSFVTMWFWKQRVKSLMKQQQVPTRIIRTFTESVDASQRFTVMSYNILANGSRYALSKHHDYCPLLYRQWVYRWPLLQKELLEHRPSIICLQETTSSTYEQTIQPAMQAARYYGIQAKRSENYTSPLSCSLFINQDVFAVINSYVYHYHQLIEEYFIHQLKALNGADITFHAKMKTMSENLVIAHCQTRTDGSDVIVVCTHLHHDPANPEVKTMQAYLLIRAIIHFIRLYWEVSNEETDMDLFTGIPIVIAGDFNSLPTSGVYDLFTQGILQSTHPEHPAAFMLNNDATSASNIPAFQIPCALQSAYGHTLGMEPLFTHKKDSFQGCLDYIFVSPSALRVTRVLQMPFSENTAAASFPPIPNQLYPSDHISLLCELQLIGKQQICSDSSDDLESID